MDEENKNEQKNPAFESLDVLISRWKDGTFSEIIDDWKWIFSYSARYKGAIAFYVILGIFSTSMGLVSSVASKYMIDIITGYETSKLWVMILIMVGSTIFSLAFSSIISRISTKLSIDINNDIQADIFDKIVDADWLSLNKYSNGDILNFTNIANDVGLSKTTIREWYQILTDTLLGVELQPFTSTKKRKAIETAKYYLFDVGILRTLLGCRPPTQTQTEYGNFFETFLINELRAYLCYKGMDRKMPLSFWRSTSGYEVDAIIGREAAIETKTSKNLIPRDFRGLRAFSEEALVGKYIIVCREERRRLVDGFIMVYPWQEFLEDLWDGKIV